MNEHTETGAPELGETLATPRWLWNLGLTAWLLVGVALFLAGAVFLLSLTTIIVGPVITAAVVAAVAAPLVSWLARHRVPRAAGSALLLLAIIALGALVFVVVVAGITSEAGALSGHLSNAKDTIEGWFKSLGVSPSKAAELKQDASAAATEGVKALLGGLDNGIKALSSLVVYLALATLSLFFLLKDGPTIRAWGERHMGVPEPVARSISTRSIQSMQGYFFGLTVIALFNAAVVLVGSLLLGVPLAGTIAAITFIAAYIPYLGAWAASIFAVLIALGGAGTDAAVGMLVLQLLANSVLQQLVQPFAMGAALGIHPLAVLIVTIAGGAVFGTVGLLLAAPLTAAAVRVSADLTRTSPDPGPSPISAPA